MVDRPEQSEPARFGSRCAGRAGITGDAARSTTLAPAASRMPGVTGVGKAGGATLRVSCGDGVHWTRVTLHRTADGSWTADVKAPDSARCALLRTTAQDDAATRSAGP